MAIGGDLVDYAGIMQWGKSLMIAADEFPLEPGYRYFHGLRVAELARRLAENMTLQVDKHSLYIGGFLHDVGKAGYKGPNHGPRGAELVRREIPHLFEPAELELVCNIIGNHYMRPLSRHFAGKEKPSFADEVLLVQDADTLDHFGFNGIWIAFHWGAKEGYSQEMMLKRHHEVDAEWRREAETTLNFELSKRELACRIARMYEFHVGWRKEEAGELICLR